MEKVKKPGGVAYYSQIQKFGWLFSFLMGGGFVLVVSVLLIFEANEPASKANSLDIFVLCVVLLVLLTVMVLLARMRVELQLHADALYVRFFPFHFRFRKYNYNEFEYCYLRKFDAYSEYGGIGLKGRKNNLGYIISGDTGLQLVLKTGKRIIISTEQEAQLQQVLLDIKQYKAPA